MLDRTIVRLKELSASHLVNNLINTLIEINWDYIRANFPDAYQRGRSAGDQQYALELIASYVSNANIYMYDYLVSCLPYSAPLHHLNDLRHIYQCAVNIADKQHQLEKVLAQLEQPGLKDTEFENIIVQAKKSTQSLFDMIRLVEMILFYKINTYTNGKRKYHSKYITATYRYNYFGDVEELKHEYFSDEIQKFTYIEKKGKSHVIDTTGLQGALADEIHKQVTFNSDFTLKNIVRVLTRDLDERIEKCNGLRISYKLKLNKKKSKFKVSNISQQAVIKQQDMKLAQLSEKNEKLTVENANTLQQLSFLANQLQKPASESHDAKIQAMQKAAQASGLRFKK
jgi:hypothetical protein